MTHGENAAKCSKNGKEWWGKRPLANTGLSNKSKVMKFWKRLLHKIERRQGKEEIRKQE